MNQDGEFHRDASDRLCYEMFNVDANAYPRLVSRIVGLFDLRSTSETAVGLDCLLGNYTDGSMSVGLDWDNWSGFIVTAHSPDAEPLVQAIAAFLSDDVDLK